MSNSFCEIHASFNDLDEHYPEQSFKTPTSVTSVNDTHPGDSKQLDQIIDKFKSCVEVWLHHCMLCCWYFCASDPRYSCFWNNECVWAQATINDGKLKKHKKIILKLNT